MPHWNRADFNAIVAALHLAELRVHEMAERFGRRVFIAAMHEMLDRNRRAMSAIIQQRGARKKAQYFEDYICDDGVGMGPYKIACRMWREGDKAIFDFAGTDPQSISSVNFLLNEEMFKMFLGAFMINLFDPQILFNDGFYDLVDVRIPEGSLSSRGFRRRCPAARTLLGRIFDIMGGLLGQGAPEALNAAGFSDSPHLMYSGYDHNGEWYQLFQIGFGGIPGRPVRRRTGRPFAVAVVHQRAQRVPRELLPAAHRRVQLDPRLRRRRQTPRRQRLRTAYRVPGRGPVSIHDDRWLTYPWGVNGGKPGARSRKLLKRVDGTQEMLPAKAATTSRSRLATCCALRHLGRRRLGRPAASG
jgi:N-methylhydantoinase B